MNTVTADQLVFTSLKSRGAQGYRIVASSGGVDPQEKRRFQTVSPSHQALIVDSENAVGISYYPLATGRYCVSKSLHAGAEPSGRGGYRVYTHGVILDEAGMAAFSWNPFNVLYAMSGWEPDLDPLEVLEPALLTSGIDNQFNHSIAKTTQTFDVEWLRYLLECVVGDRRILVPCGDDPISVARTLLTALPASVRNRISFSAGIRYSLGRQLTMSFVGAFDPSLRRLLLGQPVMSVDLTDVSDMPPLASSAWGRMVEQCWRQRAGESLIWLTGRMVSESDDRVLDEIADANTAVLDAEVALPEELIGLVKNRAGWQSESELMGEIIERFWISVSQRLAYWLGRIDGEATATLGKSLVELALDQPVLISRIKSRLADCLCHWGSVSPVKAGQAAVLLARQGAFSEEEARQRMQSGLFDGLSRAAKKKDCESNYGLINELVQAWGEVFPSSAPIPAHPIP